MPYCGCKLYGKGNLISGHPQEVPLMKDLDKMIQIVQEMCCLVITDACYMAPNRS